MTKLSDGILKKIKKVSFPNSDTNKNDPIYRGDTVLLTFNNRS